MTNRLLSAVLLLSLLAGVGAYGNADQCEGLSTGDATNRQTRDNTCDGMEPVDMSSGAFLQTETDMELPGVMPLRVTRYYQSNGDTLGLMGKDWYMGGMSGNLSRDTGLYGNEVKNYYYSRPDNCRIKLEITGEVPGVLAVGYTSGGEYYRLSEVGDEYVVTDKAGNRDVFQKVAVTAGVFDTVVQVGRLERREDASGNRLEYSYNNEGQLLKVEDARHGRYVTFAYSSTNKLVTSVSDQTGREVRYEYNKIKVRTFIGLLNGSQIVAPEYEGYFLEKVSYGPTEAQPLGVTRQYRYNDNGLLEGVIDGNGNEVVTNSYYPYERQVIRGWVNPQYGQVVKQQYLGYESVLSVRGEGKNGEVKGGESREAVLKDPKGQEKRYRSDGNGNVTEERVGEYVTKREYAKKPSDAYWKTKEILPGGGEIQYSYDGYGNVTKVVRKAQQAGSVGEGTGETRLVREYTYDTGWYHQVKTMKDENGNVTTYDYGNKSGNPSGKVLKITHPAVNGVSGEEEFTYHGDGQLATHKHEDGTVTKYEYYARSGYLKEKIEDANGKKAKTSYEYDKWGNISSVTDPNGNVTRSQFDELGNLVEVTLPSGEKEHKFYDGDNNVTQSIVMGTNGEQHKTENVYNEHGQLVGVRQYRNATQYITTGYEYDENGDKSAIIDALGRKTKLEYDERQLVVRVTDALNNTVQYAYDANGNRVKLTDELGRETQFTYDGFDRLQRKTYADGSYQTWGYDKVGNVTKIKTTGNHVITAVYDARNRKQSENRDGSPLRYGYDSMGRLASAEENGQTISYEYDSLGRVTKFTDQDNRASAYQYDLNGNRTQAVYPSGITVKRTFDGSNRLLTVKNQANQVIANYGYDQFGRLSAINLGNNTTTTHNYDQLNRMTGINHSFSGNQVRNYTYGYNDVGMKMFMDGPRGHVTYQYNSRDELTATTEPNGSPLATQSWSYDAAYNRTNWTQGTVQTDYQVNNLNQYTTISNYTGPVWDSDGNLQSFNNQVNTYDALGRLTSTQTAGNRILYSYDPLGRRTKKIVQDLMGGTLQTYEYHHDGDEVAVEYRPDNTWTYYIGPQIDRQIARINANNQVQYYYHEAFNVSALANASGTIIEKYEYNPQGQVIISDANNQTHPTTQIGNDFLFAGRNLDFETGNYYVRARYYNPTLGRFISRDPLHGAEFSQGSNLYAYCGNNFINLTDPRGCYSIGPGYGTSGLPNGIVSGNSSHVNYVNINISGGYGFGMTGGVFLSNESGVQFYIGTGATTPGVSISLTYALGDSSTIERGSSVAISGNFGLALSGGGDISGTGFMEAGAGWPPGVGIFWYYTFPPLGKKSSSPDKKGCEK